MAALKIKIQNSGIQELDNIINLLPEWYNQFVDNQGDFEVGDTITSNYVAYILKNSGKILVLENSSKNLDVEGVKLLINYDGNPSIYKIEEACNLFFGTGQYTLTETGTSIQIAVLSGEDVRSEVLKDNGIDNITVDVGFGNENLEVFTGDKLASFREILFYFIPAGTYLEFI
jgi:hypothetical protein